MQNCIATTSVCSWVTCTGMHGTHNIFQVSFSKLRFRKTLLTPQKLLNFYYAKKLAVISFWPSMWADRMQNIAHQASSTEHNLFLQHFEDWFKKEYFFEILSSPWWSTTKYQMTANRSQEMKKEAAKEQRVRDQDMSIIDMKKSFRYLKIPKKSNCEYFSASVQHEYVVCTDLVSSTFDFAICLHLFRWIIK